MPTAGQLTDDGLTLLRLVGTGSHSNVFLAITPTGQPRAVKIFPSHLESFANQEYEHALNLTHPRLAPVLSRTTVEGLPALVTVFAKGRKLFERYRKRPTLIHDRRAFLLTLADVLEGLAFMHQKGLLHRDVKPDNILVEENGRARLVDYDLSGPIDSSVNMRVGTELFQSPEAQQGERLTTSSDIYSVGVLLGWGLTGQLDDLEPELIPPDEDELAQLWQSLTQANGNLRPSDASAVRIALQL